MTFKDLNKRVLGATAPAEEKTTPATKNDGKKAQDQEVTTVQQQTIKPSDDDEVFDNMPV